MVRRLGPAEVLAAIVSMTVDGVCPTVREVKDELEVRSPSDMHRYLERLQEEGLVTWMPKKPRTLRLTAEGRALLAAAA